MSTKAAQIVSDRVAPAWYGADDDPDGKTFRKFHAVNMDAETDLYKEAVKARWPVAAPQDALVMLGRDHGEEKAPRQTWAAYRAMLETTWTRAERYGTGDGVVEAVVPLGFDATATWCVDVRGGLGWGGSEDWPSFFVIIASGTHVFEQTSTWDAATAASYTWDTIQTMWDLNMTGEELSMLRRLVRRWKDARSFPIECCVVNNGRVWDEQDALTWADATSHGTTWDTLDGEAVHIPLGKMWGWWDVHGMNAPTWDQLTEAEITWFGLWEGTE